MYIETQVNCSKPYTNESITTLYVLDEPLGWYFFICLMVYTIILIRMRTFKKTKTSVMIHLILETYEE